MSLAVLIPAYNAERTLADVLARITGLGPDDCIVVVDDGSKDRTAEVAVRDKRVRLVRHERNLGYGGASKTLYVEARRLKVDVTVNVHADGGHYPEDIPLVVGPILRQEADMVVGSRTLGILGSSGRILGSRVLAACFKGPMPAHRFIPNLLLTGYQNLCYGTSFHSFHDGFRACSRHALETVSDRDLGVWYQFDTEYLLAAHAAGIRIKEVPVGSFYQSGPASSVPPIRYGLRVVAHATRYALGRRAAAPGRGTVRELPSSGSAEKQPRQVR